MLDFASMIPQLSVENIGSGLNAASAGIGIMGLLKGNKPSAAERQMAQRQADIDELSRALQDPNHPYNKYLQDQESQLMRNDQQTYLRDLINANQRQAIMGRQTLFDPERQDEALNRYVTRGAQRIAPQARLNANNRILRAIQQTSGSMAGLNSLATMQNNLNQNNSKRRSDAFSAISDLFKGVSNNAGQANSTGGIPTPFQWQNGASTQPNYFNFANIPTWQSGV